MKIEYQSVDGKFGPMFQIGKGVRVALSRWGKWEVFMQHNGTRQRKSFGSGEEALEKAIKAGEALAKHLHDGQKSRSEWEEEVVASGPDAGPQFIKMADDWLRLNKKRWAPGTYERYSEVLVKHICPRIARVPLKAFTRGMLRDVLIDIGETMSDKSLELIHAVMSGIFSEAMDAGFIDKNPAQGLLKKLLPPKRKRAESLPDPFSKSDRDFFLDVAKTTLRYPYPIIFRVLANTGMRLGECLAMRVDNLESQNNTYKIAETFKRERYGTPKSGIRIIDLPDFLTVDLNAHILKLRREALAAGKVVDRLFPGISQNQVRQEMRKVCQRAGMRARTPHDLRHTYATILLMAHTSPAYVQKQLGHHSITETVDTYGHWIPGEGRRDLEKALRQSDLSIELSQNVGPGSGEV